MGHGLVPNSWYAGKRWISFFLTVYEPFSLSLTSSCQGLGETIDFALVDPIFKQRSGQHSRAAAHC